MSETMFRRRLAAACVGFVSAVAMLAPLTAGASAADNTAAGSDTAISVIDAQRLVSRFTAEYGANGPQAAATPRAQAAPRAQSDEADAPAAAADEPVDGKVTSAADLAAEIAAAKDGTPATLTLTADVALDQPLDIPAGKRITLTDDGTARAITYKDLPAYGSGVITVEQGASLTFDGAHLTLDGTGAQPQYRIIRTNGAFTLKQGTITGADTMGTAYMQGVANAGGVVLAQGADASFTMTGGAITGNKEGMSLGSATVFVSGGAKFDLSGGEISRNDLTSGEGSLTGDTWKDPNNAGFHAPVWIYPDGASTFTMTGGAITGNTGSLAGAVLVGYPLSNSAKSTVTMTFTGGSIADNKGAAYSGGISLFSRGSAPVKLDMSGEAKITGNIGPMGGGIATSDDYATSRPNRDKDPAAYNQWLKGYPEYQKGFEGESFTMKGGVIAGNKAVSVKGWASGTGGGVYIATDTVTLTGGTISGNFAEQGGGVYVSTEPYVLTLTDALVTKNTATVLGGGIWLCPTGDLKSAVRNGGAVFDNTASSGGSTGYDTAAGADVASVSKTFNEGVYLSNRLLGNWLTGWYQDGAIKQHKDSAYWLGEPDASTKRYDAMTPAEQAKAKRGGIVQSKDDLALQAVTTDTGKQVAQSKAKLVISDNTAERGGGIGANGAVVFGEYPVEFPKIDVTATKVWKDDGDKAGARPQSVKVALYEDGEQIDEATLNADNGWTFTWTDLQKIAGDDPVQADGKSLAKYEVKEVGTVKDYTASVSQSTDVDGDFTFTLTNTYVKPSEPNKPGETGGNGKPNQPKQLSKTGSAVAIVAAAALGLLLAGAALAATRVRR
ncbi:Cna B-type domain-containing protein [Bifidobacterium sp. CP2]|uniref:Cna B-type domain-containing protein n=1 Tax=Bifidobacterium sp. CP2 TaxID=2809025 RepID=UPI001BDCBAAA|nr:Cna B-type domain-containing protein [Bifidobacterium sp. CP2]MBT1180672.1 Cna B-type domain-containing protein [Bifidobacterium sp. CP2]